MKAFEVFGVRRRGVKHKCTFWARIALDFGAHQVKSSPHKPITHKMCRIFVLQGMKLTIGKKVSSVYLAVETELSV